MEEVPDTNDPAVLRQLLLEARQQHNQQLQQLAAQRVEEQGQHNQQLAALQEQHNQQLAAQRVEEQGQHNQQLAALQEQHNQQLADAADENRNIMECSIRDTYTEKNALGNAQAKIPPLDLNPHVSPSTSGHERKGQIIAPAKIHRLECEESTSMWISPALVTIPTKDEESRLLVSLLGTQVNASSGGSLTYSNEVDIQQYVRNMVIDAITALGLKHVLQNHVEVALYGIIPDVIVVRIYGRVVFFVEVKCPDVRGNIDDQQKVFTSTYVAGQVYSYLMAMLQHGHARPTGALMTYNKMCLVSLKDMKDSAARKTLVEATKEKLKNESHDTCYQEDDAQEASCDGAGPPSPSRTQKQLHELVHPYVAKTVSKTVPKNVDQDMEGAVYYSSIHEGSAVFPALLQAIQLAYDDSTEMQIDADLPVVVHHEPLGGRLFLKGNDKSTKFVVVAAGLKADAENFPQSNSKTFYLLAQLGAGKAGTTYLSCNTSGRLCAIKMFIPKRSVAATADQRALDWDERFAAKEEEVRNELARWKRLYEDDHGKVVFGVTLCGNPCLLMPYGVEIPLNERCAVLESEVKPLLTKFAQRGFAYRDLRWRHILRDAKKKLFLADLESLDEETQKPPPGWVVSVVEKQVELLGKSIANPTAQSRKRRRLSGTTETVVSQDS